MVTLITSNSLQTVRRTPECNIDTRGLAGTMSTGGAPSPLVICFEANKFVDPNWYKYRSKSHLKCAKSPLPVDVNRSKARHLF